MSKVTTKAKIRMLNVFLSFTVETKGEKANYYVLKLRPHVTWSEDTIDNEHLNRKRSKSISHFFVNLVCRVLYLS